MGPTGSGKSSFVQAATGHEGIIGHNLRSYTTEIGFVELTRPEHCDADIVFVDTPGFDDTSDVQILEMIADWLKKTYRQNVTLSGILYFHRISDNRMAATPLKNVRMFEKLCGEDALSKVILTTTMWDEVDEELGEHREQELRTHFWDAFISQGSTTKRFKNTPESAWGIVAGFLEASNQRFATELQQELVDLQKDLPDTRAGQEFYNTFSQLAKQRQDILVKILNAMKHEHDENILEALRAEYEAL
ncbi:hypothetical protein HGRIS_011016 [Hohenbuehelia grisea]